MLNHITKEEIDLLESLLDKLRAEIGYRYCVCPSVIADGVHIGIYNSKGDLINQETDANILKVIEKIKQWGYHMQDEKEIK